MKSRFCAAFSILTWMLRLHHNVWYKEREQRLLLRRFIQRWMRTRFPLHFLLTTYIMVICHRKNP